MVEEDPRAAKEPVALAVILRQVKAGDLADAVGAAGMERRRLPLRHLLCPSEHLRGAGEVELAARLELAAGSEDVVRPGNVDVHGREAVREALRHEALRRVVVALV